MEAKKNEDATSKVIKTARSTRDLIILPVIATY